MNRITHGMVWTRTDNGWCSRAATMKDMQRLGLLEAWAHGHITYKRAADEIRTSGLSEAECAP